MSSSHAGHASLRTRRPSAILHDPVNPLPTLHTSAKRHAEPRRSKTTHRGLIAVHRVQVHRVQVRDFEDPTGSMC